MEKKFRVLRVIGTFWKVLAWISLVLGILLSLGILLAGILGSGGYVLSTLGQEGRAMPSAVGVAGGVLGFVLALVMSVVYFLVLYGVGELMYLLLAIEENTRRTVQEMQQAPDRAGDQEQP